jgi:hypothetical protein
MTNPQTDVVCTSIVDVTVLKTSEFVYLISEYVGKSYWPSESDPRSEQSQATATKKLLSSLSR